MDNGSLVIEEPKRAATLWGFSPYEVNSALQCANDRVRRAMKFALSRPNPLGDFKAMTELRESVIEWDQIHQISSRPPCKSESEGSPNSIWIRVNPAEKEIVERNLFPNLSSQFSPGQQSDTSSANEVLHDDDPWSNLN